MAIATELQAQKLITQQLRRELDAVCFLIVCALRALLVARARR